jgi:hypothetical protein
MSWDDPNRYETYIARALATPGGHLSIGRGGFTLHFENSRLSGYDCEFIKKVATDAGLPVIDSRMIPSRAYDRCEHRAKPQAVARTGICATRGRCCRISKGWRRCSQRS